MTRKMTLPMARWGMAALALLASMGGTLAPRPVRAQETARAPRLDELMSPEQRRATGVDRLSAAERAALEAWLGRYTATVAAVSRSVSAPAPSAPAEVAAGRRIFPGAVAEVAGGPCVSSRPRARALRDGAMLCDAVDGGSFLTLEDGTMWEVYLPDRPTSVTWRPGDFVLLREDPAPVTVAGESYGFQLDDGTRGRVRARYAGRVAASGAAAPETPDAPGSAPAPAPGIQRRQPAAPHPAPRAPQRTASAGRSAGGSR